MKRKVGEASGTGVGDVPRPTDHFLTEYLFPGLFTRQSESQGQLEYYIWDR